MGVMMKKTSKLLTLLVGTIFLLGTTFASKVGYVNVDEILTTLPKIQKASADIRKEFSKREAEILKLSSDLEARVNKFKKDKDTMLQDDANKEIKSLLELENVLKRQSEQLKDDIRSRNEEVLREVQNDINDAINKIAELEAFDIVLYQNIAYVSATSNITNLVIEHLLKIEE